MSSISIGLRTEKNENNKVGYTKVENISNDETCVLYLGGDGSITDKNANGYAKVIENEVLDVISTKVPVYSVTYNFDKNNKSLARRIEYVKHRKDLLTGITEQKKLLSKATEDEFNPTYINELFEKVLLPRISQNNGKNKLSTEEACKRIRKLNIVAHCHGGYVALKLEEKMQKKLVALGYNKDERNLIQSQLLIIGHAPACPLGISKSQFISFACAYDDFVWRENNLFYTYIRSRFKEEARHRDAQSKNDKEQIAANRVFDFKPCYFAKKQGNLFLIKQKYKDSIYEIFNDVEHNNVSYKVPDQTTDGQMLAHFAKTILRNSIRNSLAQKNSFIPLPSLEELILSDNPQMQAKEKAAFEEMTQNGKNFRKEICNEVVPEIKEAKKLGTYLNMSCFK